MPLESLMFRARVGLHYDKACVLHHHKILDLLTVLYVNILVMTRFKGLHIVLYLHVHILSEYEIQKQVKNTSSKCRSYHASTYIYPAHILCFTLLSVVMMLQTLFITGW